MADKKHHGAITLKLDPINPSESGLVAITNANNDMKLRGLEHPLADRFTRNLGRVVAVESEQSIFLKSLWNIVSKLDLFVHLVDETAKVTFLIISFDVFLRSVGRYTHMPISPGKSFRRCTRSAILLPLAWII